MKIKMLIGFIFYCTIGFSQKTIVQIGFEKQHDSLLYKYINDDVYPMSQTLMDKKATDIGKYYGDTLSRSRILNDVAINLGITKEELMNILENK